MKSVDNIFFLDFLVPKKQAWLLNFLLFVLANAFCIFFMLNQLFVCFSSLIFAFFVSRTFDESLHLLLQILQTRKIQNQGNSKNGRKRPFIYDVGKKYQKVWTPFPTSTTIRFWFGSQKHVHNNCGSHVYKKIDVTLRVFPYSWTFFVTKAALKFFSSCFPIWQGLTRNGTLLFCAILKSNLSNFENKQLALYLLKNLKQFWGLLEVEIENVLLKNQKTGWT